MLGPTRRRSSRAAPNASSSGRRGRGVVGPPSSRDRAAAPWHHTGAIEAETHGAFHRADKLNGETERALANGVAREDNAEVVTHIAFYAGCLTAMTAARIA
jgi:hypothetical protein